MDVLWLEKDFIVRSSVRLLKVGDVTARSYFFDLGIQWSDLTEKDKRSCAYVIKHIHKFTFGVPEGVRAYELSALGEIVATFYCRVKRNERSIIAYKGGHFEKVLLASLAIPSVNLECFGCPKAGHLMCDLGWLETCGKHVVKDAYLHCPKVEVEAYGCWMEML